MKLCKCFSSYKNLIKTASNIVELKKNPLLLLINDISKTFACYCSDYKLEAKD